MSTPTSRSQGRGEYQACNRKTWNHGPRHGAVATTLIAGVEAVRKGIAKPIGSSTQMGTIRLGKRTDSEHPLIKDFVPLAHSWTTSYLPAGISSATTCTTPPSTAQVLDRDQLETIRPFLEAIKPMPAVFDQHYVKRLNGQQRQDGQEQVRSGQPDSQRHPAFKKKTDRAGDDLVRLDGDLS